MKLLCDVNLSQLVVDRLRSLGFDAVRASELLDPRSDDERIVEEARRLGAVVVTRDLDFSAILAMSSARTPSLVSVRVATVDPGEVAHVVARAVRATAVDLEAGAIVSIDDAGVRVHALPIE